MALGYDGKLYILAFDHRGSFQKKMFGIEGEPTPEETTTITDAKRLVFEGMEKAVERGVDASAAGVLVDEQFGGDVPKLAREHGLALSMPVEKSGQDMFDFQYGEEFGEHILSFDPQFSKVLVRYNPDGDAEANRTQLDKLKRLADWLHENDRKFLFELLVPGRAGAARVGRRRRRPLRRRAAPGADAAARSRTSRTTASRSTSGRSRASTGRRTRRCWSTRRARATAARTSCRCCSAAARATRRSTTGSSRPPRSRASSASRSAARSGGTR